jgi:cell surface protein SprA
MCIKGFMTPPNSMRSNFRNTTGTCLKGVYKSSVSNEIKLGGFNLPPGSVIVTAGGQMLQENLDYEVNYSLGTVRIINDGILNSGVPVDVKFENNILFGVVNRTL